MTCGNQVTKRTVEAKTDQRIPTTLRSEPPPVTANRSNVLVEMGVPPGRASDVFETIINESRKVGFLTDVGGKPFVDLAGAAAVALGAAVSASLTPVADTGNGADVDHEDFVPIQRPSAADNGAEEKKRRSVFITHGRNKKFVEPIKQILAFGELEARVAVQEETTSIGVLEKIMSGMRECGAAIIHVDADSVIVDSSGKEHTLLNPNVLIEIGAAMALYGSRVILLVKDGVQVPSNLQGLYRVQYSGDDLGSEATVKLMGAINDMKKR